MEKEVVRMKKIKEYILKKIGILKLRKKCSDLEDANKELKKSIKELKKSIKELQKIIKEQGDNIQELKGQLTLHDEKNQKSISSLEHLVDVQHKRSVKMENRLDGIEEFEFACHKGLNQVERKPRIIVSLTSFPQRITILPTVLMRIFAQTLRPDKVVIWLAKGQFPNQEEDLPVELLEFKKYGLEIKWCDDDMKAYKKSLPSFKEYPDDIIIIIDDDLIYRLDHIEKLYKAHMEYPNAIIGSRAHKITLTSDGKVAPYGNWGSQYLKDLGQIKEDWFFTGGAGTLFPPHIFGEDVFNYDVIREMCPYADDIWLNIHAAINKVPIVSIGTNNYITDLGKADSARLWDINKVQNDIQLEKLVNHYHEQLRGSIYNKIES